MCAEDLAQTAAGIFACRAFADRADVPWSGWETRAADEEVCLSPPAPVVYAAGDRVLALWTQNGKYYPATVAEAQDDGKYLVDWETYSANDRAKTEEELRPRPPASGDGAAPPGFQWYEY